MKKKRVLVVDDDELQRKLLCRALSRKSVHSEEAACFGDAVEQVSTAREMRTPFDLVVLDLSLPDVDDPYRSLARSEEFGDTPIIYYTGLEDPALIREFQKRRRPFILKGASDASVVKAILTEIEWQEPSEATERAILDTHLEQKKAAPENQSWLRRNSSPVSAAVAVVMCLLAIANQTTGSVAKFVSGTKEEALTAEAIRQSLASTDAKIEAEKKARELLETRMEKQNIDILTELRALREDAGILHRENEVSKTERTDLKGSVGEIKTTVHDIYNALLKR